MIRLRPLELFQLLESTLLKKSRVNQMSVEKLVIQVDPVLRALLIDRRTVKEMQILVLKKRARQIDLVLGRGILVQMLRVEMQLMIQLTRANSKTARRT